MDKSLIEDIYPLSPMQEGFLFQSLYDPDPEAYFVQLNFRFRGKLQPSPFRNAWLSLCARHGGLRSAFLHEGLSRPAQVVLKRRPPEITFTDLRHLAAGEQQVRIDELQREDRRRGFNLTQDVLLRIAVFHTQPDEHYVVWSFHHILIDGWGLNILQREFLQIYVASIQGQEPNLPPVFPYGNYLRWLEVQDREDARRYWREYLSGYQGLAGIPRINRNSNEGYALQELMFELDAGTTSALRSLAAQAEVTFNTLVQSVWAIVLARYNNVPEVVFGMIVSGRPPDLPGVEQMLGLCINAVPVRIRLEAGRSFTDLLQSTQKAALESQRRHHLPLAEIQAQRSFGGDLFDHLLIFENYPVEGPPLETSDPGTNPFTIELLGGHDRTHYPFTFIATPGKNLHVRLSFNANVYPEDQMQRTRDHFITAVRSLLENPRLLVDEINILPIAERKQLLSDFNHTRVEQEYEPGLVGRFEAQVRRTPDHIAIVCEDRQLTYQELNERANRLARYLRDEHHVQPDDRIGLLLDRSEYLPVAIWGILKAGAAYVPIDPESPAQRARQMLTDSACRLVVSEAKYADQVARGTTIAMVDVRSIPTSNPENLAPVTGSNHLAYVIYTSGSTGLPKGCQIELGNLVHYLCWADRFYFAGREGGCFGLYSPVSFDLTVTSLFLPLLRGKTLHVFPAEAELLEIFDRTFCEDSPLDSIKLTPSHISLLHNLRIARSNIRLAIVGGEALSLEQVRTLRRLNPQMEIYNEYGPTETTVGCVVKRMEVSDERVLIGQPIANTRIYVMSDGNLMPIGTTGEILIAGAGVGRGYFNRDDLNRRAFPDDPNLPGQRLYRTGDLGRWLPDGNLELLGRADYQVKVRGYRIELGEIENRLLEFSTVRHAVVTTRNDTGSGNDLVAYVVAEKGWTAAGARAFLAESLPDYMVPVFFVNLETLPLTPNGKVDRKALPHPSQASQERTTPYAGPRDDVEKKLAEIWRKVLALDEVNVHDRFLDLGGHSLKAMQIVSQIHKQLGTKIPLRALFEKPTIAELATVLRSSEKTDYDPIEPASLRDYYELSHAQQRLWLLQHLEGASAYNMPAAFVINEAPHMVALNRAFGTLIERHEALRTAFVLVDGEPRQQILPPSEFLIEEIDFRASEQPEEDTRAYVEQLASTPFDLARPPLLRAAIIQLSDRRFCFALIMHHIIGDGWSEHILYREVLALYEAYRNGRPNPLRPLRIQYKDFAVWQNARGFQREEEYWLKKLAGSTRSLSLKYDFPRPDERDFRGTHEHFALENEIARPLRSLARRANTTIANVLLAIFKLFLFRLTGQEDICIGMGSANRNHPDVEHLIGFFVNALPIRTRLDRSMEFDELLGQIIDNTSEALEHGDYPFDLLVRRLNPTRTTNRQPLFNVAYVFQNLEDLTVDIAGDWPSHPASADDREPAQADAFPISLDIAKFDLTLVASDGPRDSIALLVEYDTNLFRPETIQHYLSVFRRFAQSVAQSAEADQESHKASPSEVH